MDHRSSSGRGSWGQPLSLYIRDLRRCKPMTREEEHAIATEYARTRDEQLARRLVESNLRLVIKIAGDYSRFQASLVDLIQEGNIGLLEAVTRFDPNRGVRLASYAGWWIRAYILKYLLDTARIVRIGRTRAGRRGFFHGQAPPADLSLDDAIGSEDSARTFLDFVADASHEPADATLEGAELQEVLREHARRFGEALDEREAAVFHDRLLAEEPKPRKEIASRFALSRERIRQIENRLIDRFRVFVAPALGLATA
jgi:RNA polymerase sigma-32 factor